MNVCSQLDHNFRECKAGLHWAVVQRSPQSCADWTGETRTEKERERRGLAFPFVLGVFSCS